MFQEHTREVLNQVGAKDLIPHGNLAEEVDLLTLVKKKKGFFTYDYEVMFLTLGDLIPAFAGFSEFKETTLIEDYKHTGLISGRAGVQTIVKGAAADAGASDVKETSSVDINEKAADLRKMKEISCGESLKMNPDYMPTLRKGEVLGYVSKIVFNTNAVHLRGRTEVDGSLSAFLKVVNLSVGGKMKDDASLTVPAGQTYGYLFNEIKFKAQVIVSVCCALVEEESIVPVPVALEPETFEPDDSTEETLETLQQVREKLLTTETVLKPLADLPLGTRFTLFQNLSVLSEDRDALTLLKRKLDQVHAGEQPEFCLVCSVLHLVSGLATTDTTLEAVYLLVSAMDKLPEHVTSLIAKNDSDTLRGLNQLVSSLMEDGQAHLSESLPAALRDGGQLHWLAEFLCSSDESLRELSELTVVARDEPGVLMLALCVAVRGLSMLRRTICCIVSESE